jgi:methylated-DNA-[protein]-cysteine S-methyltransferase
MKKKRDSLPGRFRSLFKTDLGFGGVVASEVGILEVFLPFSGESADLLLQRIIQPYPDAAGENRLSRNASILLRRYFAGERVSFDLPLDLSGSTEFQASVYRAVSRIPYGCVMSYGDVAKEIGRPRAARGVGSAMAANPLPVIIPCHRVVGASGDLTGYSGPGGVVSKKWLLEMEGAAIGGNADSSRPDNCP